MLIISLEYQGKTFDSTPMDDGGSSVDLMHLTQTPCGEFADIEVFASVHGDAMVQTTGQTPLTIERYGRKRECTVNHPIKLFKNDILWVGANPVHRLDVKCIRNCEKAPSLISKFSKNAVLASAAALVMATVPACNQPKTQSPKDNTVVEQNTANGQDKDAKPEAAPVAPLPYPEEMGEPPEEPMPYPDEVGKMLPPNEPMDYPQPVGIVPAPTYDVEIIDPEEPSKDQPQSDKTDPSTPQKTDIPVPEVPKPNPQKIGKPAIPPEEVEEMRKNAESKAHPRVVGKSLHYDRPDHDRPMPMGIPVPRHDR